MLLWISSFDIGVVRDDIAVVVSKYEVSAFLFCAAYFVKDFLSA